MDRSEQELSSSSAEPLAAAGSAARNVRVLLAGPAGVDRDHVYERLATRGHAVTVVDDCRSALRAPMPEYLVADLIQADGRGIDLFAELERRSPGLRAVMYARSPGYLAAREALQCGARDVLAVDAPERDWFDSIETHSSDTSADSDVALELTCSNADRGRALRELIASGVRAGFGPAARARLATAAAELLDNAARHAYPQCTGTIRMRIRFEATEVATPRVSVEVADNGIGFNSTQALLTNDHTSEAIPNGLSRARALVEDLTIDSTPGAGSAVRFHVQAYPTSFSALDTNAGLHPADAALDANGCFDLDWSDLDHLDPQLTRQLLAGVGNSYSANLSPALAVVLGRLLQPRSLEHSARRALLS